MSSNSVVLPGCGVFNHNEETIDSLKRPGKFCAVKCTETLPFGAVATRLDIHLLTLITAPLVLIAFFDLCRSTAEIGNSLSSFIFTEEDSQ